MEEGEEIFYAIHYHIITIFKPILKISFFYIFIPGFLYWIIETLSFIWLIWIAIGISKILSVLFSWYFNALLVTNLNLVNVEWKGLFNRQANRIEYSQIESFSYTVIGLANTIFNFGDITIDKSSGNQITIQGAYRPKQKAQLLTKIQDQMVNKQLHRDHEGLKGVLTNLLRHHIQEHGVTIIDE
jgi:hypothetical protein